MTANETDTDDIRTAAPAIWGSAAAEGDSDDSVITKAALQFSHIVVVLAWASAGLLVWIPTVFFGTLFVCVASMATLFSGNSPQPHVAKLQQTVAVWPNGFRMLRSSFQERGQPVAHTLPDMRALLGAVGQGLLFYGGIFALL